MDDDLEMTLSIWEDDGIDVEDHLKVIVSIWKMTSSIWNMTISMWMMKVSIRDIGILSLCTAAPPPGLPPFPRARCRTGTPGHSSGGYTRPLLSSTLAVSVTREHPTNSQTPPSYPLDTGYITPTRTPYPIQSAQVEVKSGRV